MNLNEPFVLLTTGCGSIDVLFASLYRQTEAVVSGLGCLRVMLTSANFAGRLLMSIATGSLVRPSTLAKHEISFGWLQSACTEMSPNPCPSPSALRYILNAR